jgi:hypothetical protein
MIAHAEPLSIGHQNLTVDLGGIPDFDSLDLLLTYLEDLCCVTVGKCHDGPARAFSALSRGTNAVRPGISRPSFSAPAPISPMSSRIASATCCASNALGRNGSSGLSDSFGMLDVFSRFLEGASGLLA